MRLGWKLRCGTFMGVGLIRFWGGFLATADMVDTLSVSPGQSRVASYLCTLLVAHLQYGGAVSVSNGEAHITSCTFADNAAVRFAV